MQFVMFEVMLGRDMKCCDCAWCDIKCRGGRVQLFEMYSMWRKKNLYASLQDELL